MGVTVGSGRMRRGIICLAGISFFCSLAGAAEVENLVVTSRKTEENLQDVPLAITAFSEKTIEEARIETLDDVAAQTPGLNFFNPIGEILPVPVIRGVAPTDIFGEPNAAVFVDGVYAAGREGLNFSLLEVERIEVNKGPQSALYGRNAFSGAINYVTKRPSDVFEGNAAVTLGNRGRTMGKASVSGPLVPDHLAGRMSVAYDDWDGSYDNPVGSNDVGGYTYRTFQAGLNWTPTDTMDFLANFYYSKDSIDDAAITGQIANCENVGTDNGQRRRFGNFCGELLDLDQLRAINNAAIMNNPEIPDAQKFYTGSEEIAKIDPDPGQELGETRKVTRASLKFNWEVGPGTLTTVTGYSKVTDKNIQDGTRNLGYAFPFVYCDPVVADVGGTPVCSGAPADFKRFYAGELVFSPKDTTEEFSQEIRFSGPTDNALRYSVGGYFFSFRNDDNQATLLARSPTLPPGLAAPPGTPGNPPPAAFGPFVGPALAIGDTAFRPWFTKNSTIGLDETRYNKNESYAGFGLVEWDATDRLTFEAQLRYTIEKKSLKLVSPALNQSNKIAKDFEFWTGRLGARYRINEDWMVYASVANGTKAGGFDGDVVDVDPGGGGTVFQKVVIVAFDEEKLQAYELGTKLTTWDGRARFDLAVYMNDWTDIVIPQVFDRIGGDDLAQPEGFNTNAGDATIWGTEVQGDFAFTDNFSGGFGLSWTDAIMDNAKLESFADFPSFVPDGDVSGNTMLRQPKWQANGNLRYGRPFAGGNWEWSARTDVSYQGEYFGGLDNQWTIPSHTYVNLRFALESDRYTISLWAKNLFNNNAVIAGFRDVYFGNTDDVLAQQPVAIGGLPPQPQKFFPFRITATNPKLRTFGMTAQIRFGGS